MSSALLIAAVAEAPEAAEPTAFWLNPGGWVALAVLIVFALLIWKKVPGAVGRALDSKIALIRDQLAEAESLRKEAEALIERRTRMAEEKIAAEERSAVEQLRAAAADAATKAAARIIADRHDATTDAKLVDKAIKEIAAR
jgi:F-type H+-transporting ATPase subunit b